MRIALWKVPPPKQRAWIARRNTGACAPVERTIELQGLRGQRPNTPPTFWRKVWETRRPPMEHRGGTTFREGRSYVRGRAPDDNLRFHNDLDLCLPDRRGGGLNMVVEPPQIHRLRNRVQLLCEVELRAGRYRLQMICAGTIGENCFPRISQYQANLVEFFPA